MTNSTSTPRNAIINGGQEGQTPVEAATDADGVATFRISSPVAASNPVYFEANLVKPGAGYPYAIHSSASFPRPTRVHRAVGSSCTGARATTRIC